MTALVVLCVRPEGPLCVEFDVTPKFRLAFFDFTGSNFAPECDAAVDTRWSIRTRGKGEVLAAIARQSLGDFDILAVLDDDVGLRVSDINRLLFLGRLHGLDIFQPSLSHDSHSSFPHLRHRPGFSLAETTFVEVMAPFFSRRAFDACRELFAEGVSGWGIDIVWSDRMRKSNGKLAIVHEVVATHSRPVTSHTWVLPSGETPRAEMVRIMKAHGLEIYEAQ